MKMTLTERFLKYVKIDSQSDEYSDNTPTTEKQFNIAKELVADLKEIGCTDAVCDSHCYVYAHIPATKGYENRPAIGFIGHMDTSPDFSGTGVNPIVTENYNGKDLPLGSGRTLKVSDFPDLKKLKGRTLITSDGSTLLGADDKAGVTEIICAAEKIIKENIPHGKICICFTPDEETGGGTKCFDLEKFGADFAYTLDGEIEGEIVCENFNAAHASFEISGFNVHPGSAKNTMKNASQIAFEINSMLPSGERPEYTEHYEGFYHLCHMSGNVESAKLEYIVRDHDSNRFEARKKTLIHIEALINEKYGKGTVKLELRDQYRNMAEIIERKENRHLIENAVKAIKAVGLKPVKEPIRGGTDGAALSFLGLPCPNLGTGGYAFHGPYEHCTVEGMQLCSDIAVEIAKLYAEKK